MKKRTSIVESLKDIKDISDEDIIGTSESRPEYEGAYDVFGQPEEIIEDLVFDDKEVRRLLDVLSDYPDSLAILANEMIFNGSIQNLDPDLQQELESYLANSKVAMRFPDEDPDLPDIDNQPSGVYTFNEEDSSLLSESKNWDKFTKDIIKRERSAIKESKEKRIKEDSPQREYNKRYREDWRNSTRWSK